MSNKRTPKFMGIYQHYKGCHYLVCDFATDANTGKQVVIYKSLREANEKFVRTSDEFMETVTNSEGEEVERFRLLRDDEGDVYESIENGVRCLRFAPDQEPTS